MKLSKAVTLSIGSLSQPVVTLYQLGVIVHKLYRTKSYKGESLSSLRKEFANRSDVSIVTNELLSEGVLSHVPGLSRTSVFGILGHSSSPEEDIVCTIDPFCYVSHLSAMEYHGLTNRMPKNLFVSSPSARSWRRYADEKMKKDLEEDYDIYRLEGMPSLTKTKMEKVKRKEIHRFDSEHLGAFKHIPGRNMRVSTLGRTFLDMIRNPELCGGINHVLDIYKENAESYLKLIVNEIDQHGRAIDKVRVGYILDEYVGLNNESIEKWQSFAQRGGSRKLDSSGEYMPDWSDKWMLSINVF